MYSRYAFTFWHNGPCPFCVCVCVCARGCVKVLLSFFIIKLSDTALGKGESGNSISASSAQPYDLISTLVTLPATDSY